LLFTHLAELQPQHHQPVFEFAVAESLPGFRVFIGTDEVDITPGCARRRALGDFDGELEFGHESDVHHELIQSLQAVVGEDARENRGTLEFLERTSEIAEEKPNPRPIMAFAHHIQRLHGHHGRQWFLTGQGK